MEYKKNDDRLIMVGCSPCQYYSIINTDHSKAELSKDLLMNFARFIENVEMGQQHMSAGVMSGVRNPLAHEEIQNLKASGLFTENDCLDCRICAGA